MRARHDALVVALLGKPFWRIDGEWLNNDDPWQEQESMDRPEQRRGRREYDISLHNPCSTFHAPAIGYNPFFMPAHKEVCEYTRQQNQQTIPSKQLSRKFVL